MLESAQYVLAAMLSLLTPGKSIYSRIAVPFCDAKCQDTPLCDDGSLACEPPILTNHIYKEYLAKWPQDKLNTDEWLQYKEVTKLASFTRMENYSEGLKRYALIAGVIDDIAQNMTWKKVKAPNGIDCHWMRKDNEPAACKNHRRSRPWVGNARDLALILVTTAYYESGFRRDVHSGVGPAARGDCEWRREGKKVAPRSKGAVRVPGSCRSVCLTQIQLGPRISPDGWTKEQLVGLDRASTRRCLVTATRYLAAAKGRCSGYYAAVPHDDWARATMTGYGTGGRCWMGRRHKGRLVEDRRFLMRGRTFWTLKRNGYELSNRVRSVLNISS